MLSDEKSLCISPPSLQTYWPWPHSSLLGKEGMSWPSPHLSLFPPTLLSSQWPCAISGSLFLFAQYFSLAFKHTQVSSISKDTKMTFLWPHGPPRATRPTVSLLELWSTSSLYPPFPNPSNLAPTPTYSTVLSNLCNPLLCRSGTKFTNNWGRCISKAIWKISSFHLSIWQGWLHCLLAAVPSAATCLTNPLGLLLHFRFLFLILPSGLSLFTKLLNSGSS